MTRWEQGTRFTASPQGIAMVRERLQRMGLPVTEAAARSLVEGVLALEGPRLYALAQGTWRTRWRSFATRQNPR